MCLHIVAVTLTTICMPAVLYWLLDIETNNIHRQAMRNNALAIAHYLRKRPDGGWTINLPAGLRDVYSKAYGRYAYAVLDNAGNVLFSTLDESAPLFPPEANSAEGATLQAWHGSAMMSGASVRAEIGDQPVWVQVGENLEHRDVLIDDVVADFFRRVGWVIIPILAALLIIDITIFRRALQPLLRASQQAQAIGPSRTDVRLPSQDMPKEIRPLVLAVNQALDRLEEGFRVQRELTADAAHELRTPLAILRMRADTLIDHRVGKELQRDIQGMCQIVDQLLAIAELETFVLDPLQTADLTTVCREVAETIAPFALAQGKDVALTAADGPVCIKGNPELLRTAIRNLVENAITHTPQGSDVEIVVGRPGTVSVLDRGPGVPAAEREVIFQRFWRRDRRRSGSAGLGLAIVRRIVTAHGATISVEDRPSGGAQFSLSFVPAEASGPAAGRTQAVASSVRLADWRNSQAADAPEGV
jgi:signal transduction histidine kinase